MFQNVKVHCNVLWTPVSGLYRGLDESSHITATYFSNNKIHVRFQVLTTASVMEAVHTSETSVDNYFTRQYNPEDSSEQDSL
jgi:hypothetical protein